MFDRMISAPRETRRSGVMALTVAWVPTGMKTGVFIVPWAVWIFPRRAFEVLLVFMSSKWGICLLYGVWRGFSRGSLLERGILDTILGC